MLPDCVRIFTGVCGGGFRIKAGFLPDFGKEAYGLFTDLYRILGRRLPDCLRICTGFRGKGFHCKLTDSWGWKDFLSALVKKIIRRKKICWFHSMLMSWEWQWTFSFRIQHLSPYIASASVCIFRFCDQSVPLFSTSRVDFYLTKMVSWLIDRWNVTIKQDSITDAKQIHHNWQWKTMRNFRLVCGSQQCFHVMWFWWFFIHW